LLALDRAPPALVHRLRAPAARLELICITMLA
jgi:hypothetical protein